MALTPSTMLPLGVLAVDFYLLDVVSGKTISRSDFAGKKALLVIFLSRHCPYVQHIKYELVKLGQDYSNTRYFHGKKLLLIPNQIRGSTSCKHFV
jgi:peroxiredoxin